MSVANDNLFVGLTERRERPSLGDIARLGRRSEGSPASRGEAKAEGRE